MIFAARNVLSLLLVPVVVQEAFRIRPRKKGGQNGSLVEVDLQGNASLTSQDGVIDSLYTWGAPMTAKGDLVNSRSSSGCWDGLRIITVKVKRWSGIWGVDIVPTLLKVAGFKHPKMPAAKVNEQGGVTLKKCGWTGNTVEKATIDLHMQQVYVDRAPSLAQPAANITSAFLWPSYYTNKKQVASYIKPFGWRLVGSAMENEKVSHLMQHPRTLECVITFQGSSHAMDWWDNIQFGTAPMCGLSVSVHQGFRSQVRWTTQSQQWQSNIRTKLGKCKKVTAVGHSLGGAMAALFSACVNKAPKSGGGWTQDYKYIHWKKETPKQMPAIA